MEQFINGVEETSKTSTELALEARYRTLTAKENDLSEREAYLSNVKGQIIELAKSLMGDDVIVVQREDFDTLVDLVETAISNSEDSKAAIDDLQSEIYDLKRNADSVESSAEDASSNLESSLADLENALDNLKGLA